MKLAIISHTAHYKVQDGTLVGWGPTVNEINHLLEVFDEIWHLAVLYDTDAPLSTMPYISGKIIFVPIPSSGGIKPIDKLNILWNAPKTITTVSKVLKSVDYFQLRVPTGIGVYLIPYLTFFTKIKGWFKYAGNWNQKHPPLGYAIQRFMLKNQSRKVTINGQWENQQKHCITFENPCLTKDDLIDGQATAQAKTLNGRISFCFVGRLEKEKGVERIIYAFKSLEEQEKSRVNAVHLVGDGKELNYFKSLAKGCCVDIIFHKYLSRKEVFEIYKKSHVFLLPSTASEGFPKVIAEAMNFGCLPIVSDLSSIGQYVKHNLNGFLLKPVTDENLVKSIKKIFELKQAEYVKMIMQQNEVIEKFTFSNYNIRIKKEIYYEMAD